MSRFRRSTWRLAAKLSTNTLSCLQKLETWQWLPEDQLRRLQRDRVRALLEHVATHVPWYRRVAREAGVLTPDEGVNLAAFQKLPLLTKEILRGAGRSLLSEDVQKRRTSSNTSGGSTGEPVRFVQDRDYHDWNRAVKVLQHGWAGRRPGDKRVLLWGSERDLSTSGEPLRARVKRWLRNEVWLNTFRMGPDARREYIECINRERPVQILAYVESIYDLARLVLREDLSVWSPRSIVTTAGTLYPEMRETVERAFQCGVYNRYGSREVGSIASECAAGSGLHVAAPTHLVEILRPDGSAAAPGEEGEVVVTSLTNFAMPLIRYRIGDLGRWAEGPCSCGRDWPRLEEVSGRVIDIFASTDGGTVHGQYFIHLFYYRDWVEKFQVVQEEIDRIRIRIVPRDRTEDPRQSRSADIEEITQRVQQVMGEDCVVEFDFPVEIPPSPSGKFLYTISRVAVEDMETSETPPPVSARSRPVEG